MNALRFIFITVLMGCLVIPLTAIAQMNTPDPASDTPLSESELIAVFNGQTHSGSYNFIRRNIKTFSFEERTAKDGSIHHVQGDRIDTGQWSIKNTQICYHYDAEDLNPACFEIYQRGNCYHHYQKSVRSKDYERFTARSVIKGEEPDCAPRMS